MKTFTFSNTQAQRNEVIFYTFHPDLIDASEKQLKEHIKILCKHTLEYLHLLKMKVVKSP